MLIHLSQLMLWKIILRVTIVVFSTIILFSKHGCVFCLCLFLFLFFANPAPHHVFFPHSFHYTFWTLYPLINKLSFLFFSSTYSSSHCDNGNQVLPFLHPQGKAIFFHMLLQMQIGVSDVLDVQMLPFTSSLFRLL